MTDVIQKELQDWGRRNLKQVCYVMKGQVCWLSSGVLLSSCRIVLSPPPLPPETMKNALTEMYSVIKAEVPVESDAATSSNEVLLARLRGAGEVGVG